VKVGDIVNIKGTREFHGEWAHQLGDGIIVDSLEDDDGFFSFLIFFKDDLQWFRDLEIEVKYSHNEVISEDR
jgi:hypothetical protein